jgi:hypothetical protein
MLTTNIPLGYIHITPSTFILLKWHNLKLIHNTFFFGEICEVGGLAITHKRTSKFGYKLDKKIKKLKTSFIFWGHVGSWKLLFIYGNLRICFLLMWRLWSNFSQKNLLYDYHVVFALRCQKFLKTTSYTNAFVL